MDDMPTSEQSISQLTMVLSTYVFEKMGKEIIAFTDKNRVESEHPYEQAFRLGLAVLFREIMELTVERK